MDFPPAPSLPSGVTVSQNGVDSVQVSWTPPSGEPAVTGYIIYYQQQDGGHNGSEVAGATATTKEAGEKYCWSCSIEVNLYILETAIVSVRVYTCIY